ncbi:MAG TPA: hypothetical protein VGQ22_24595 [Steroidobacteraceae bacterium]|jgi:hypothetical protein|nr:hypothetical protein [Steroidobacteraceae bacterium]
MRFLELTPDTNDIEASSYARYVEHLDAIERNIPRALYLMLRFPEQAYKDGQTIYDSILVEWRDILNSNDWKTTAHIRILSPNFDQEFLFTFNDPSVVLASSEGGRFRLGELYCLEVSQSQMDNTFSFCFMFMTRTEIRIDCTSFEFVVRPLKVDMH